jgi:hypothetical protein
MRRSLKYVLSVLALLLVALIVIRERYEPRLALHLDHLLSRPQDALNVGLDEDLALRLHSDSRPHVGKIATLQKGLVLIHKDRALIEEGYGFGLPIIEVNGVAHISRHARTSTVRRGEQLSLVKSYRIDVVDRPTRPFRVKYADVASLGTVVFSYTIRAPDAIDVTVDFGGLNADWDRAYMMNEQGARSFTRYVDSTGRELEAADVGIWEETTAPFGCWEAPSRRVRFCVEAPPGQRGFVGRERYRQYNWLGFYALSWSGIDIAVEAPLDTYTYTIRVQHGVGQ